MPETEAAREDMQGDRAGEEIAASAPLGEQDGDGLPAEGVVHQLLPNSDHAGPSDGDGWRNLHRMMDVPLSLTVELGSTELPLSEVLRLDGGSVITLNRLPGEPIDLLINGRVFARGEVVVINETFGYRITELVDQDEATTEMTARTHGDSDGG